MYLIWIDNTKLKKEAKIIRKIFLHLLIFFSFDLLINKEDVKLVEVKANL